MVPVELMKSIKQLNFAETGFLPKAGKQPRKAAFLAEMDTLVPWSRLEALIEPFNPRKGNGRPPMPIATMLRIHFMQQCSNVTHLIINKKTCSPVFGSTLRDLYAASRQTKINFEVSRFRNE